MKIKMEIDMTPQEMRELFGLPDVQPIHQEVMERIRDKILKGVGRPDRLSDRVFQRERTVPARPAGSVLENLQWRHENTKGRIAPVIEPRHRHGQLLAPAWSERSLLVRHLALTPPSVAPALLGPAYSNLLA